MVPLSLVPVLTPHGRLTLHEASDGPGLDAGLAERSSAPVTIAATPELNELMDTMIESMDTGAGLGTSGARRGEEASYFENARRFSSKVRASDRQREGFVGPASTATASQPGVCPPVQGNRNRCVD